MALFKINEDTIQHTRKKYNLDEAFVPKSKGMKEMEKCLHVLRMPYLVDYNSIEFFTKRFQSAENAIQDDPNLIKFCKLMEKEFVFESMSLVIVRSDKMNALTLPVSKSIDKFKDQKMLDSTGMRYLKEARVNITVMITDSLLFNDRFTDAEILSILLHEIGHNFSQSGIKYLEYIRMGRHCIDFIVAMRILLNKDIGMLLQASVNGGIDRGRELETRRDLSNYIDTLGNVMGTSIPGQFAGTYRIALAFFTAVTAPIVTSDLFRSAINKVFRADNIAAKASKKSWDLILSVLATVVGIRVRLAEFEEALDAFKYILSSSFIKNELLSKSINKYMYNLLQFDLFIDESFSDKFVALHGYGPEFVMAMGKIQRESYRFGFTEIVDRVPFAGEIFAINYMISKGIVNLLSGDPHPLIESRIKSQLDILEADLKDTSLNPKTRAALKDEIERTRESIERYNKALKKDSVENKSHYIANLVAFESAFSKVMPAGDIREWLVKKIYTNERILKNLKGK